MMKNRRHLDWDSKFFGFNVVQVQWTDPGFDVLEEMLLQLKKEGVRLVYWCSDAAFSKIDAHSLRRLNGYFVDEKRRYVANLKEVRATTLETVGGIVSYTNDMDQAALIDLALQGGEHSRFAMDPNIPEEKFNALYTIWLQRSLRKEIADEVLVAIRNGKICGLVTIVRQNDRSSIGLIAVDQNQRRKGIGKSLVMSVQRWSLDRGLYCSQVVTQGKNRPACKLYQKSGYDIEKIEYYYHFWL